MLSGDAIWQMGWGGGVGGRRERVASVHWGLCDSWEPVRGLRVCVRVRGVF